MCRQYLKYSLLFIALMCFCGSAVSQDIEGLVKSKSFDYSGGLNIGLNAYSSNRENPKFSPFSYTITATPTIMLYGISIPLTFVYSEQQRSFRQPFNRYGMSPSYKFVKLHVGYRNVSFNKFTLAGHSFLGGGIELTPGKFKFGFIYGRFNKATANVKEIESLIEPSFDRKGYAFKIGYGGQENNIEFSLLKAIDQVLSPIDTSLYGMKRPEENLALGLSSRIRLFKVASFYFTTALSAYTNNIFSTEIEDDFPTKSFIRKLIVPRNSTNLKSAAEAGIDFNFGPLSIGLGYKRIDPDYKSMGAYGFLSDIEDVTLSPSLSLLKGKINLTGNYGVQRNNLNNHRLQDSRRNISAFNISVSNIGNVSGNISYNNYKTNQISIDEFLLNDSFDLIQVSRNIQGNLNYTFRKNNPATISVTMFNQNFNNQSQLEFSNLESNSQGGLLNYNFQLSDQKLSFNTGITFNNTKSEISQSTRAGFKLGASKSFTKKIRCSLSAGFINNSEDGIAKGFSITSRAKLSFKVNKKSKINFAINYIKRNNTENAAKSYDDFRTQLNYSIGL